MKIEFVSISFVKSCTSFKTEIRGPLPDYHSTTLEKGVKGCIGIFMDELGGFDILGESGQHFWVSPANVVWGRKACHPGDNTPYQKPTLAEPVKVEEPVVVVAESNSLLKQITTSLEPAPVKNVKLAPKPRGRPKR